MVVGLSAFQPYNGFMSDATDKPRRFQFSLSGLFVAFTMVSVGIGGFIAAIKSVDHFTNVAVFFGVWYACGALVGAGLFSPFKKKSVGAIVGFVLTGVVTGLVPYFIGVRI